MQCDFLHFQGVPSERFRARRSFLPLRSVSRTPLHDHGETLEFFHDLFDRAGLTVTAYRERALSRRVAACLRFLRADDLAGARRKLDARPELAATVLNVVLLGVTDFCRDPAVFCDLWTRAMPVLASLDRPLRVWSAACSDGRELFSVGILLREAGLLAEAEMLGTDCRREAITAARSGRYPAEVLAKVEPSWRRHFAIRDHGVQPVEELRRAMRWKVADVLRGGEAGPWDLIAWRNMAIYLEPAAAGRIWQDLRRRLLPGGYLVTGKADNPPRHLGLEKIAPCIYRKPAQP